MLARVSIPRSLNQQIRLLSMSSKVSSKGESTTTPMYRFEATLPELPVPTLENTAARYLKSIKAFHLPQAPGTANNPEPSFKITEKAVESFLTSPSVKTLQERLLARAAEKNSWLSEWWNETAYFGWRGPVVPWVVSLTS